MDLDTVACADCREWLPTLPDSCVDLIATDPPYFKVKSEPWDRQWDKPAQFLEWLGGILAEFHRVLKPNGSLYLFASPQMAARVECLIAERFNVLNRIRWVKEAGWHNKTAKDGLRAFLSPWEEIIFAEHHFEPLRAYLAQERDRAGWTTRRVAEHFQQKTGSRTVTGMAGHWFEQVQWALPTAENYAWLQALFNAGSNGNGPQHLRREYEYLRREYEDLRRPFTISAEVPYTDVWTFPTVQAYAGKHPCEKPLALMEHIITASSKPGAMVLDCFAGSGTTAVACQKTDRHYLCCELGAEYVAIAEARIKAARNDTALFAGCD